MKIHAIRKILVPVDFSPLSGNALSTAISIGKRQLATLTLIHVVDQSYPDPQQKVKEALDMLSLQARESRLRDDLVINHLVLTGDPAEEVCQWAQQEEFDLIVIGKHSALAPQREMIGSTARKVVWTASCPVMTIPGTNQWFDFKKILFPVRLIPHALDKYEYTKAFIFKNNASLLVTGLVPSAGYHNRVKMKNLMEIIQYKMEADTVDYTTFIQEADNVSGELLSISNTEKPDLIVITAASDAPIKEFFQGPFLRNIIDHAKFPVLSIRPFSTTSAPVDIQKSPQPVSFL